MKLGRILAAMALLGLGCGLVGCATGSVADIDSGIFAGPPEASIVGASLSLTVYDSGRQFLAVEKPFIKFRDNSIFLRSEGYVRSAGGVRTFRYYIPADYQKVDLRQRVFWVNSDGKPVPIRVLQRELPKLPPEKK